MGKEHGCPHCKFIEDTFHEEIKSNYEYWIMTEVFVYLHGGKDYCNDKKSRGGENVRNNNCSNNYCMGFEQYSKRSLGGDMEGKEPSKAEYVKMIIDSLTPKESKELSKLMAKEMTPEELARATPVKNKIELQVG